MHTVPRRELSGRDRRTAGRTCGIANGELVKISPLASQAVEVRGLDIGMAGIDEDVLCATLLRCEAGDTGDDVAPRPNALRIAKLGGDVRDGAKGRESRPGRIRTADQGIMSPLL